MVAAHLTDRDLMEVYSETDPERRIRFDFPISRHVCTASTSVVYFELEPGEHTGMHSDSAEEVVLILAGTAEATVGNERGVLETGGLGVVPALVPHDVRNVGDETLKVVGFFSSNTVVSVFDDPMLPAGKRVVGSPLPQESDVAVVSAA